MSTPVFKKPIPFDYLDTTDTLAANSDTKVPSQKAVKTYVDTQITAQIPDAVIDAKGDLIAGSADNTPARLAVGTNGKVLTADDGEATGMKWAEYGTNSLVINETPSGTVNGSNAAFDTASAYVAGSIQVYRDGQLMKGGGADYTETDSNTITFTTAPATGSVILVTYQTASAGTANADTLDGQHAPTGTIVGTTDTQTLENKRLTSPKLNEDVALTATATQLNAQVLSTNDGWISANESWAYASASTITVPSGAASKYSIGDSIRWKQGGGYKYGVISAVADTVLTIIVNTDYTVADAAITDNYYTHQPTAIGLPAYYNFTPSWTNITLGASTNVGRYKTTGRLIEVAASLTMGASFAVSIDAKFNFPVSAAFPYTHIGQVMYSDTGSSVSYYGRMRNDGYLKSHLVSGSLVSWFYLDATHPFTWATTDVIGIEVVYHF